jgi:tight adherence protein C
VGIGLVAGIMGPELALGMARRRFVGALRRGTPDALDLLVVCSEAGMGLESALERVSQDMRRSNRAMASVLSNLLDDLRVLPDRRDAFANLGTRSGVEGLRRFGTMLSQSLNYGTPLSNALRAVATELRRERMNKLEEKAVKLPALLIFPLIFFVMPSLYIVLLGPSFLRLYDSLAIFAHH